MQAYFAAWTHVAGAHSFSSSLTGVPPYSGSSTFWPSLTLTGMSSPFCRLRLPGPVATTTPSLICRNQSGQTCANRGNGLMSHELIASSTMSSISGKLSFTRCVFIPPCRTAASMTLYHFRGDLSDLNVQMPHSDHCKQMDRS